MESIKWFLYKILVKFIGQPYVTTPVYPAAEETPTNNYVWVFCSTIGELNGCKPLISELNSSGQLVLITDRDCYQQAFQKQFPDAIVVEIQGWQGEASELLEKFTPKQFVLCEIPCLPNDAPCRLSYDFLRTLKKAKIPISAVNGWLYEYAPSCRQDSIERQLFTKDYLRCFGLMMVQNNAVKDKLIAAGQFSERIHVTGNMKFDAVNNIQVSFKDSNAKKLVEQISGQNRTVLVAGSMSDKAEYAMILDAFCKFQLLQPEALVVMAPRHPEKKEQIEQLESLLEERELKGICRSALQDELPADLDVLILDTFGELQGMYYGCDFAYIGKNHNVLEPLAFGKPVVILDGWEATYPSYPVYEICLQADLVFELNDPSQLADKFSELANIDANAFSAKIASQIKTLGTALEKNRLLLNV